MINLLYKRLFIFDKDDTLTPTKSLIEADMIEVLKTMLISGHLAIISGSSWNVMKQQVVEPIKSLGTGWDKIIYLPASGSQLYTYNNGREMITYDHTIDDQESKLIERLLLESYNNLGNELKPSRIYSSQVENRGGQITMSVLGQNAPINQKQTWDPDRAKRRHMVDWLIIRLPSYDIKIGGTTSIDVTKKGINKEFGVRSLIEYLQIPIEEAVYFGDSLEAGGNDHVVTNIGGLEVVPVTSHHETLSILRKALAIS